MATETKPSIAIVGGGIGGLCTAIGLLKEGVKVDIYEAAAQFSEIGAGVSVGPNAARALKMIDPALYSGYLKTRTNNAWPAKQNYWFTFRIGDDGSKSLAGTHLFELHCDTGQSSVHRAKFLDELVALIPKDIAHFRKRLVSIDEGDESVTLHFTDNTSATHTAAIGCDGVKSITRPIVLRKDNPSTTPTFSAKYAYRGLIPMPNAVTILGDELARNAQMYLGHGAHVLTYPISNGDIMNVVAICSKKDGVWEGEWVKGVEREVMEREFEGWCGAVRGILGGLEGREVWGLFDHPKAEGFVSEGGRVCLLGDAAHASTPHCGAGAGQAVEDALILSHVMGCVKDGNHVKRAFEAYDKVRRPRSQMQVEKARFAGLVYDMEAPGIGDDLEKVKESLSSRKWLWDHDLEADVRKVERLFWEGAGKGENGFKS